MSIGGHRVRAHAAILLGSCSAALGPSLTRTVRVLAGDARPRNVPKISMATPRRKPPMVYLPSRDQAGEVQTAGTGVLEPEPSPPQLNTDGAGCYVICHPPLPVEIAAVGRMARRRTAGSTGFPRFGRHFTSSQAPAPTSGSFTDYTGHRRSTARFCPAPYVSVPYGNPQMK